MRLPGCGTEEDGCHTNSSVASANNQNTCIFSVSEQGSPSLGVQVTVAVMVSASVLFVGESPDGGSISTALYLSNSARNPSISSAAMSGTCVGCAPPAASRVIWMLSVPEKS